jgi:D-tagatose-1,6-bisphosphate aldolase subunit GatZ/KbaZ
MEWSKFKLGVGPMSPKVVDACLKYSYTHNFPLMFIASRNQVDFDDGYAFNTQELTQFIKSHEYYDENLIKICRDHCGPNFSDKDKKLNEFEILERCKNTIKQDINNGFDLIHIDVSRVDNEKQSFVAESLIDTATKINNNIALEFGCEDNTGTNLKDTLNMVDGQIQFAKQYDNIIFLVNQTGSLTKQTQVGIFNEELSKQIADKIHNNGFLFKEHNADYLNLHQVKLRKHAGIDSINIAPQLGYTHTYILNKLGYNYKYELNKFKQFVLEQGYWKKWVTDNINDEETKFLVSAHYFFNSEYARIISDIISHKKVPFAEMLFDEVSIVLDQYRLGYGE